MYSYSVHPLLLTEDLLEFTGYGPCGSLTSARYNSRSSGEHLGATIIVCLSAFLCLHASLPPCLFCLCASSPRASVPSSSCASVPLHHLPLSLFVYILVHAKCRTNKTSRILCQP